MSKQEAQYTDEEIKKFYLDWKDRVGPMAETLEGQNKTITELRALVNNLQTANQVLKDACMAARNDILKLRKMIGKDRGRFS